MSAELKAFYFRRSELCVDCSLGRFGNCVVFVSSHKLVCTLVQDFNFIFDAEASYVLLLLFCKCHCFRVLRKCANLRVRI